MKILPLNDRIVVKPIGSEGQQNIGGIIIPDTAKDKPQTGTVISISSDETLQKQLKIDDVVIYNKYAGVEFEVESVKYMILKKDDLLGVIWES